MRRAAWSGGRLAAWDLAGRATEIEARVVVDTPLAGDRVFSLGGHDLALIRQFETDAGTAGDFGNWRLPLLDTRLTHDQAATTAQGTLAPWREGARVWLQVPASPDDADAPLVNLRCTLATSGEALAAGDAAPRVFHPVFNEDHLGSTVRPQKSRFFARHPRSHAGSCCHFKKHVWWHVVLFRRFY